MTVYIDITNLSRCRFLTGIQRVVREILVRFLRNRPFPMVLLCYDRAAKSFHQIDSEAVQKWLEDGDGVFNGGSGQEGIGVDDMSCGDVFFDLDAVWHLTRHRTELYPLLKSAGVRIVSYIYDIIPISYPQFYDVTTLNNFLYYVGAALQYADTVLVSTKSTLNEIQALCGDLRLPKVKGEATWLGSDFESAPVAGGSTAPDARAVQAVESGKYVLMVGTIQPLKNHAVVLDAFEKTLFARGLNLVFAGKIGWNIEGFARRIREQPLLGRQFFMLEGMDDASIDYLYRNAFCLAFATFNEGFGLPTIEAFQRGTPVVCSDVPVLREVGGDFCRYFDPKSADSFAETVLRLLDSEKDYAALREKVAGYKPVTWDEVAEGIAGMIERASHRSLVEKAGFALRLPWRCLSRRRAGGVDSPEAGIWERYALGDQVNLPLHDGFSEDKAGTAWTNGTEAQVRLHLDDVDDDLLLEMEYSTFCSPQPVEVFANDFCVDRFSARGKQRRSLPIPRSLLHENGTLLIRLKLPGAISPKEVLHTDDTRLLALLLSSMTLSASNDNRFDYMPGDLLSFADADGAPALEKCLYGVSHPERNFTWTEGGSVCMVFQVRNEFWGPSQLILRYRTLLPAEHVLVSVGDTEVERFVAHGEEEKTISIPPSAIKLGGGVVITLALPDAVAPKDLGKGADARVLALRLFSVRLE